MLAKSICLLLYGDNPDMLTVAGALLRAFVKAGYLQYVFATRMSSDVLNKEFPGISGYPFDFVIVDANGDPEAKATVQKEILYSPYVIRIHSPENTEYILDFDYGMCTVDDFFWQAELIVKDILTKEKHFGG